MVASKTWTVLFFSNVTESITSCTALLNSLLLPIICEKKLQFKMTPNCHISPVQLQRLVITQAKQPIKINPFQPSANKTQP